MHGVREVDGAERVALDRGGVHRIDFPELLEGLDVFVHIDLDVLDPEILPASFPVDGGLSAGDLRSFLADLVQVCTIVGAEITSAAPEHGEMVVDAITPLLA
jgi:arginase family enzyme